MTDGQQDAVGNRLDYDESQTKEDRAPGTPRHMLQLPALGARRRLAGLLRTLAGKAASCRGRLPSVATRDSAVAAPEVPGRIRLTCPGTSADAMSANRASGARPGRRRS